MADAESTGPSRPFPCSECPKSFTRSENLKRHKLARHGDTSRKAFECTGCHARFSRSDVYKRHRHRCRVLDQVGLAGRGDSSPPEIAETVASLTVPGPWLNSGHSPLDDAYSQAQVASPPSVTHAEGTASYIKAYFENFHPALPLLHRPTFSIPSSPEVLINIVAVIGSLYSAPSCNPSDSEECAKWRQDTWKHGSTQLHGMVATERSEVRQIWVLQAAILHIIYGAYSKDSADFDEAKRLLRNIVDATRELGLLIQGIAVPDFLSSISQRNDLVDQVDSETPYMRWTSYINTESLKVSLYALVFVDSYVFLPSNARPLLSPMEFAWELPFPSDLWEAQNSQVWLQRVNEHFGVLSEDYLYSPRRIATASLSIATQQLMTESPSPQLFAALAASPFATLCVLANINTLIRDFTRCYYQMPPSPADPSAFHILTQAQNKQVYSAMRAISKIAKDQACTSESSHFLLWRTIEIFYCFIKISLCRPDPLLIGGIVDNGILAGLATSTHLTLGNYVAVRRSAPLLQPHLWGDEGILALLSDLAGALSKIAGEEGEERCREPPWATVSSYGILLCMWAALRRAGKDIRNHLDTFNELPRTSESSMLIFNTLVEGVAVSTGGGERDPRIWSADRDSFVGLLEQGEGLYISLLQRVCRDRSIWGLGPSMDTVVEEVLAAPPSTGLG